MMNDDADPVYGHWRDYEKRRRKEMRELQRSPQPERMTRKGEVLLSHNHLALLQGLYDRPGGRVASRGEWIRAASPYFRRFSQATPRWALARAFGTINRQWLTEERRGHRIEATLTERGRAIVERRITSRIIGYGTYEGLPPGRYSSDTSGVVVIPPETIRHIVNYANSLGVPLLEPNPTMRPNGTVFAVASGIGKPFRIMCREELELRGPRDCHLEWTQNMIDAGELPSGYLSAFPQYDPDELLCYLQELRKEENGEIDMYVEAYRGEPFPSRQLLQQWIIEEIDFTVTDFDPDLIGEYVRARSPGYRWAIGSTKPARLSWRHPDTGRSIGSVFKNRAGLWENDGLVVTSAAALSCLQLYWDAVHAGLQIETRYVNPNSD